MASFVAGPNKFSLLANAFTGAAKGANDFAELKQRSDALKEQKRQHDDNLELGFNKLDEQIRQFDVGTSEKSRLEGLALQARHKLGIAQSQMSKSATLGAAGIRAREQRDDRAARVALQERNVKLDQHVNIMEAHNVGGLWSDWKAYEAKFNAGETTEEFDWNTRADAAAFAIADKLSLEGPPSQAQIALAREQIDNYQTLKKTNNENNVEIAMNAALAKGRGAGAAGGGYTNTGAGIDFDSAYSGRVYQSTQVGKTGSKELMYEPTDTGFDGIISQVAQGDNPYKAQVVQSTRDVERLTRELALEGSRGTGSRHARLEAQWNAALKHGNFAGMPRSYSDGLAELASSYLNVGSRSKDIESGAWVRFDSTDALEAAAQDQTQQAQQARVQAAMTPKQKRAAEDQHAIDANERKATIAQRAKERLQAGEIEPTDAVLQALDDITTLTKDEKIELHYAKRRRSGEGY